MVEADTRRLERIVRNLVTNAIDYADSSDVVVLVDADAEGSALAVRDYGVGLRPGDEVRVFNRFWRADPSRVRRSGGTGLGLSISQEDARLHGGWLEAWGAPGAGSQFRLTLPRRAGGALTHSPLPARAARRRPGPGAARTGGHPVTRPGAPGAAAAVVTVLAAACLAAAGCSALPDGGPVVSGGRRGRDRSRRSRSTTTRRVPGRARCPTTSSPASSAPSRPCR